MNEECTCEDPENGGTFIGEHCPVHRYTGTIEVCSPKSTPTNE